MVYSPVNPWIFPANPNFPWLPKTNTIVSITNANPAVISTANEHGYSTGFLIRVVFPFPYQKYFGMEEINERTGLITVLSRTTFSVDINTLLYSPFVIETTLQTAQVIPIGQYSNANLNDSTQVNPPNNETLANVPLFQSPGLQAPGASNTSQT